MRNIFYILLFTSHILSGQGLINDSHQIKYKTLPQKNKNIKEIQKYINDKAGSEKSQKYLGLLKTFARYDKNGNIIDYHKNKKFEFLSDRYKFFYKDGELFEIQKKGISDRTLYKWQFEDNLLCNEIKYNRKNIVNFKWSSTIEDGKIIKTEKLNRKKKILYTIKYIYNNNLLEELKYINKKGKTKYYWKFMYDDKNRNIQKVKYNSKNSFIESWKIEYTENNDTLANIKYDSRGVAQNMKYFTYDNEGTLIGYKQYNKEENIQNQWKYIYNENGLLIEEQYFNKKGLASINKYEYNGDQKLLNEKQFKYYGFYDPNFSYSIIKLFNYNNKGDVKEVIKKDIYNSIISITRYIYLYF